MTRSWPACAEGQLSDSPYSEEDVCVVSCGGALEAIQAATLNAAELLGWSDRVGALEPGYFADLIAVEGDPLTDVTVLEQVRFVLKGGKVYRDEMSAR